MVTVYPETSVFGSTFLIIWNLMAILFSQVFLVAELVGLWFTYKKMELPGWKGIIPFYNSYVLLKSCGRSSSSGASSFIAACL